MLSYGECTNVFSVIPRVLPLNLLEDYCLGFIQDKQKDAGECRAKVNEAYSLLMQKGASCQVKDFYAACNLFAVKDDYNIGMIGEVQEKLLNQCRDKFHHHKLLINNLKNKFPLCQTMYQCAEHYQTLGLVGGDKTLVKERFRDLTKQNHPDLFVDSEQKKKAKINQESIQNAYGFLKDHCTELTDMQDFIQSLTSFENSHKAQEESSSILSKGFEWLYSYVFGFLNKEFIFVTSGEGSDYTEL